MCTCYKKNSNNVEVYKVKNDSVHSSPSPIQSYFLEIATVYWPQFFYAHSCNDLRTLHAPSNHWSRTSFLSRSPAAPPLHKMGISSSSDLSVGPVCISGSFSHFCEVRSSLFLTPPGVCIVGRKTFSGTSIWKYTFQDWKTKTCTIQENFWNIH